VKRRLIDWLRQLAWEAGYGRGTRFMSEVRRRWQVFRNPKADIRFLGPVRCGPGFRIHAPWGGMFVVGPHTEFRRNFLLELEGPKSRVSVGSGCYFTYDVIIACGRSIEIGDRVGLAQSTFVVDGSHRYRDLTKPFTEQGYDFRPIKIASDAQVHSKCTIIADLGERAIIAANAVVTRDIPPYTVAAGVPARVIDYYGPPGREPEGWERSEPPQAGGEVTRA
jgi:acetyltransferase-like isoleucine patch superfamily enzyme